MWSVAPASPPPTRALIHSLQERQGHPRYPGSIPGDLVECRSWINREWGSSYAGPDQGGFPRSASRGGHLDRRELSRPCVRWLPRGRPWAEPPARADAGKVPQQRPGPASDTETLLSLLEAKLCLWLAFVNRARCLQAQPRRRSSSANAITGKGTTETTPMQLVREIAEDEVVCAFLAADLASPRDCADLVVSRLAARGVGPEALNRDSNPLGSKPGLKELRRAVLCECHGARLPGSRQRRRHGTVQNYSMTTSSI